MMERMMVDGIVIEEICLHTFLFEALSDELDAAEEYHRHAKHAKKAGEHGLCELFLLHAKEELRHFENIMAMIEKTMPNVKSNPLYPLLEDLEEWADEIEREINMVR